MTRMIPLLGLVLLFGATAGAQPQAPPAPAAAPQQAAPSQQRGAPPISSITRQVIVPVTVKDNHGQLVGDLAKDEFRIFADGTEQKIIGFSAEAVPLSAVVLLDNDLNERGASQVQKSLTTIAAGFGPSDEVALVTYDEFPETVVDFSFNNDLLFTALKRLELGSHNSQEIADPTTSGPIGAGPPPSTAGPIGSGPPPAASVRLHGSQRYKNDNALNDALFASGDMLKARGRDRRKIIFLISDGSNSGRNEHSFDETLRSLLEADISVYSISVTHSVPVGKALIQKGALELEKYAADTGGDTFYAGKQPELERLYSAVTEQARNEYTLTFSPEDITKGRDYHPIEVRVRRPDLNIETREGYYESAIAPGR
ncbi:MAG TPA: VWA domain-containing protein [Candidatus Acidoferrales bacterium]|jgi:VWFA-related protein|nr:VWA domain-containing protein [Candidatus Acidoferrales bacterium]